MRPPTLDDIFLTEVIALMSQGVLEKPCRYVKHVPHVWFNDAGRAVCGVCHPRAIREAKTTA